MQARELSLKGVLHIRPKTHCDDRGFFRESFRKPLYHQAGVAVDFVQDNHSYSKRDTIRGMHFQLSPGQAKLVSVIVGKIFDVVVDICPDSPTFGKWEGVELDEGDQLFIPVGYAHGFCVLSQEAHLCYKVSSLYDPEQERSFRYDDPFVGIDWPVPKPVLSERDRTSPFLKEVVS